MLRKVNFPVSYSISMFCKLGTRKGAAEANVVVVAGRRLSPVIVLLTFKPVTHLNCVFLNLFIGYNFKSL